MAKGASNSGSERKGSVSDISSVEEEALKRVNKTMKTIEGFLAKWESSKVRTDEMAPQVARIKEFHDALAEWQKKAMMEKGRSSDEARLERLKDFVLLCESYS